MSAEKGKNGSTTPDEKLLHAVQTIWANLQLSDNEAPVPQPTKCWIWQGSITHSGVEGKGYPAFRDPLKNKSMNAHRFLGKYVLGIDIQGKTINHRCTVRRCLNPLHLEVVSASENTQYSLLHQTNNKLRKLTNDQIREIRKSSVNPSPLAAQYGVSPTAIADIQMGYAAKYLPLGPDEWVGKRYINLLPEETVQFIKNSPLSGNKLSKELNLDTNLVCSLKKGMTELEFREKRALQVKARAEKASKGAK